MQSISTIDPHPEFFSNRFFCWAFQLCKLLLYVQVGKIEIYGEQNLRATNSPIMICSNHPHYVDALILGIALKHPARYMVHPQVFRYGFGLGEFIFRKLGAFSAGDGTRSGALKACETAVNALTDGETLVMLPEGHISFASRITRFRGGAVRILTEVSNRLGKSAYIIPAYIRYGRYPGTWIHRIPSSVLQGLLMLLGFLYYRRGATVVFGKPISSEEIPQKSRSGSNFILRRVTTLGNFTVEKISEHENDQSGSQLRPTLIDPY